MSVRRGTYQGQPFQFAGHFLAEQGTDGEVTIDSSAAFVLALTVDATGRFQDAAGAVVDPTNEALHDATAVATCTSLDTQPASEGAPGSGAKGGRGWGGDGAHCVKATP